MYSLSSPDLRETMSTWSGPVREALRRPTGPSERNPVGFGFGDFARVNSLHTAGFLHPETGALAIRVQVREVSTSEEEEVAADEEGGGRQLGRDSIPS